MFAEKSKLDYEQIHREAIKNGVWSLDKVPQQALALAKKIGEFIEYWGFKEVHGRIWALVFLSPEPVDANFLIDNLNVSKALVSMSIKDLIHYNVIMEVEKTGPGTQKYEINVKINEVISNILANREAQLLMEIKGAAELLGRQYQAKPNEFIDGQRVVQLKDMVSTADSLLQTMLSFRKMDLKSLEKALKIY